jgi:tetratricopeptide (TPR) repeat protein
MSQAIIIFLVLTMRRFFSVLLFIVAGFAACTNNDAGKGDILSHPPYDKLTDSIEKAPKNADLYFKRGTLLYGNNEPAYAEKDLRQAWQLDPKEEYALRLTTVLKQKNADAAISFLQEALLKLPESIGLQITLAKGYQSKDQPERALDICNQVISRYPGQLDALLVKSDILKEQHKYAEQLAVLEKAYSYAPGDVELVYALAFAYAEAKNPKVMALSDSLIKVDIEKRHAEPYYFKGLYYENTGRPSEAIKYFDEAIGHDFNFLDAYMDKGQTWYDQKNYKEALASFQLAVRVFPVEAEPYFWLGRTQEAMGDKKEAILNYQRAYGLDKTFTEAKEAADRLK